MFIGCAVALNYYIRWRYLNVYVRLQEPPLAKPTAEELHPDVNTPEAAPAFHNYLDEFLQAVRVFGFLEKPVRIRSLIFTIQCAEILLRRYSTSSHDTCRHAGSLRETVSRSTRTRVSTVLSTA